MYSTVCARSGDSRRVHKHPRPLCIEWAYTVDEYMSTESQTTIGNKAEEWSARRRKVDRIEVPAIVRSERVCGTEIERGGGVATAEMRRR